MPKTSVALSEKKVEEIVSRLLHEQFEAQISLQRAQLLKQFIVEVERFKVQLDFANDLESRTIPASEKREYVGGEVGRYSARAYSSSQAGRVNENGVDDQSNRLTVDIDATFDEAVRVFGDVELAYSWMRKPRAQFDGQSPLKMLLTKKGSAAVDELLGQIDHGMVT